MELRPPVIKAIRADLLKDLLYAMEIAASRIINIPIERHITDSVADLKIFENTESLNNVVQNMRP